MFYDIEKNKYFRLNKATGEIEASYKTGQLPAKFDPEVTGVSCVARKKHVLLNTMDSTENRLTIRDHKN